jgi:hypothetical protein
MSRHRGRKRNIFAQRNKPTGRAVVRQEDTVPPVEGLMRRLEAVGVHVMQPSGDERGSFEHFRRVREIAREAGMEAVSSDHPLDVLHAKGALSSALERLADEEEAKEMASRRYHTGSFFAFLHWRRYGKPFAGAMDNGFVTPLVEVEPPQKSDDWNRLTPDQREMWYALTYAAMRLALKRRGQHVEAVTLAICTQCRVPRSAQVEVLRRGLDALRSADRVEYDAVVVEYDAVVSAEPAVA